MKILVTGAAGFIGSHLCEHLIQNGHEVIAVDNFSPQYSRELKENNLNTLRQSPLFHFHEIDFSSEIDMSSIFINHTISAVVHLGALPGVQPSLNSSVAVLKENVEKTLILLEIMKKSECSKIVFASSSSVYGNTPLESFDEDLPLNYAISPYASSKQAVELYLKLFHNLHHFSCTSLRFFSVYGPRQRPDMAISKFLSANSQQKQITLYNNGKVRRDYTYVDDIVLGIVKAIMQISTSDPTYRCYNLGNQRSIDLNELISLIDSITGKRSIIQYAPSMTGDASSTCADITRAKKELGYAPQVDLVEGLKKQYQWSQSLKLTL